MGMARPGTYHGKHESVPAAFSGWRAWDIQKRAQDQPDSAANWQDIGIGHWNRFVLIFWVPSGILTVALALNNMMVT